EEQTLRGRRRERPRVHGMHHRARREFVEKPEEPVRLPLVLEAVPVGLCHDWKVGELPRRLEEVFRAEALQPERRALARARARQEQSALGVLAEAGAEERRVRKVREESFADFG